LTDGTYRTAGLEAVPTRFLAGCGGDATEATRRWKLTHAWRTGGGGGSEAGAAEGGAARGGGGGGEGKGTNMDDVLVKPPGRHELDELKRLYDHFYHRR
jgi:hypothetical protein